MDKCFQMIPPLRKFWKHFGLVTLPVFLVPAALARNSLVTTITNSSIVTATLHIITYVKLASVPKTVMTKTERFNDNG